MDPYAQQKLEVYKIVNLKIMAVNLNNYYEIKDTLDKNGIDSILYGSLGASVYIGNFREFDDIDLLVDKDLVESRWPELKEIMTKEGFSVLDEKEHEFINSKGVKIAFAGNNVLERDRICTLDTGVVEIEKNGKKIRTITKDAFINAYLFSSTDGYRKEKRGRSDLDIVDSLRKLQ